MKNRKHPFSVPGISLMILILLSLCLLTFSLLTLSGSYADETLSSEAADRTSVYYQASGTAGEYLAQIDSFLASAFLAAQSFREPETAYLDACQELSGLLSENSFEDGLFSFSVPVTDGQLLQVSLEILYPQADDDSFYRITRWKVENTADWQPDTTQNLYHFDE